MIFCRISFANEDVKTNNKRELFMDFQISIKVSFAFAIAGAIAASR